LTLGTFLFLDCKGLLGNLAILFKGNAPFLPLLDGVDLLIDLVDGVPAVTALLMNVFFVGDTLIAI
jgi:hypothetical protein